MKYQPPQDAKPLQTAKPSVPHKPRRVSRRAPVRPISAGRVKPAEEPRLRLVGGGAPDAKQPVANPTPIASPTDPRWVLAVRTAELLEGDVLPPMKREKLMRTGKAMGLTAFDCSLILAIVQDRARRGIAPDQCPAAGETQLALVPLPPQRALFSAFTEHPGQIALLAVGILALQALLLWIWLG